MPLATRFNEVISMDLKEVKRFKLLHIIDNATRFSVAVRIKNKESREIVDLVMKHWFAYFGAPETILSDNGREFDNQEFRDMAQNFNIIVRTTATQSPLSNGLCERHNAVLSDMVLKSLEDAQCGIDQAVAWSVSAKNSLSNISGFSPNQLVFGYNPNSPSVLNDYLPALEGISSSEIVANNLNALHT